MSDTRTFAASLTTPAQVVLLLIIIFPLLAEVYISMTAWTPTRGGDWTQAYRLWDWGHNYVEVFRDAAFWRALGRTFLLVGVAVPLEFLLGLGLAFLFMEEFRGKGVFYALMLVPMMIVPAVAGYVFWLFFQSNGPLNAIVSLLIGQPFTVTWLSSDFTAMIAVIVAEVWEWTPLMFLIILAGLHSLPQDPIEAARVDGASAVQVFFHHTLPLLRPVLLVAVVLRTIDAVGTFDQVIVLTKGGPGTATQLISIYAYNTAFLFSQYGHAMAMLIGLLACLLVLMAAAVHFMRRSSEIAE
jgi:multiple sugar transport system permease protein